MIKIHIITIAGDLASGKSTAIKLMNEDLNYEIYRNGAYFRQLAKDKGMSVTEFNEYVGNHPEIDRQIEESAKEYAKTHDNVIVDARLGWYAVPASFKIYLTVDIDVAAKRAFEDPDRKDSENLPTLEAQKEDLIKRSNLERDRYLEIYNVDKTDMNNYDYVLDTTNLSPEEVKEKLLNAYNEWLSK